MALLKGTPEAATYTDDELRALDTAASTRLVMNTVSVILTNAVPVYGVIFKGWSSFALLLMFVLEGVIVLGTDCIKLPYRKKGFFIEKNLQRTGPKIVVFECFFIFFCGFFALIAFGPRESSSLVLGETFIPVKNLILTDLRWPIVLVAILRLQRVFQDFRSAGAFGGDRSYPLSLNGGGWMLLLFCVVMLVPVLSPDDPNAFGGLVALIGLKTVGEILGVWAIKLALLIPEKKD